MISIVYCTRESKPEHAEHLRKVCGNPKVEIIEYINKGEGLTKFYQKALDEAKNDIIVFCHDDILLETKQIEKKITKLFANNPEYGIIGVAGTKYLPESGRWWENPKLMYGKVKHTHEGKSWLSSYSNDLGNDVTEAVIVDGVFFSVHRERLKKGFNPDVKGFHFYDVDFCLRNYIEGVKVGVHTNIRVNHMSIGQTNEEWEENRKVFVERYKEHLPVKIDRTFEGKEQLKILIGCLNFGGLTGSELSTMELAKELVKNGCDVTVVSQLGPKSIALAKRYGIKLNHIQEPPGFKLGDGQWGFNNNGTQQVSEVNKLYAIGEMNYDVIHANHTPITNRLLELYPKTPVLNIVRSEVIDLENPVINNNIKQYVAIRPSIKDHMIDKFDIPEDNIEVIYNLFDKGKFSDVKVNKGTDKEVTLFVGTMDYLRREAIEDLIKEMDGTEEELWLVGKDTMGYATEFADVFIGVRYFPPTDNIQTFYNKCDKTAGIYLGRTTIEGFLCNKPGWVYIVDDKGVVISRDFMKVPEDMSIFDNDKNILKYIELYKNVANS